MSNPISYGSNRELGSSNDILNSTLVDSQECVDPITHIAEQVDNYESRNIFLSKEFESIDIITNSDSEVIGALEEGLEESDEVFKPFDRRNYTLLMIIG